MTIKDQEVKKFIEALLKRIEEDFDKQDQGGGVGYGANSYGNAIICVEEIIKALSGISGLDDEYYNIVSFYRDILTELKK